MFTRYVALGDSQTEGLCDGDQATGYRGWADRLAERLSELDHGVRYANLAVRGRLAGGVRAEQLGPALALRPDLATVVAGLNDVMRPRFDAFSVAADLETMFAELTGAGAKVATIAFPEIAEIVPAARRLRPRVIELNERIRDAARRHRPRHVRFGRRDRPPPVERRSDPREPGRACPHRRRGGAGARSFPTTARAGMRHCPRSHRLRRLSASAPSSRGRARSSSHGSDAASPAAPAATGGRPNGRRSSRSSVTGALRR